MDQLRAMRVLTQVADAGSFAAAARALDMALAVHQLAKHLGAFRRQYPQVTVELHSPGPVEAMDPAFDLTILSSRGPLPDGDFIARRLARTEVVLCASPEYLDARGRPEHPRDLEQHDTLLPPISELQRGITFFTGATGAAGPGDAPSESVTLIPQRPVLSTSHIDTTYAGALHGLGIAGLPSFVLEDALLEHALERVLPAWRLFSLAMPSRKHLPARTRVFLDFLIDLFGGEDSDPWLLAAGCETRPWAGAPPPASAAQ